MAAKLDQGRQTLENPAFNAVEELKKLGDADVTASSLLDDKVVKVVQRMFKESELKKIPKKQVTDMILEKSKGSMIENYLRNSPRLVDAFADVLRDEKAMPGLVGIFLRKDDLKIYAIIWLVLMFLSYIIKRLVFPPEWQKSWPKRALLSLLFTTISVSIFYKMFYAELKPTVTILVEHWHKKNL